MIACKQLRKTNLARLNVYFPVSGDLVRGARRAPDVLRDVHRERDQERLDAIVGLRCVVRQEFQPDPDAHMVIPDSWDRECE